MNSFKFSILIVIAASILFAGCEKPSVSAGHHLIFKFVFDSTQARLNNGGLPDTMPAGHAGQNPAMNVMSAHYIELAPTAYTALGAGAILYKTPMTALGGDSAINFQDETLTSNGNTFYEVALDSVTPGTYQWLRVSLAYENGNIQMYIDTTLIYQSYNININQEFPCTLAGFVGVNTYITSYKLNQSSITVNGNRLQGYWGFEASGTYNGTVSGYPFSYPYDYVSSGQSPAGATTVVNPLFATSPIPAGSCVVTGQFVNSNSANTPLIITGHETSDIVVTVSLSINHSVEWIDVIPDGKWEPSKGESIVNMGIRGMIPYVSQ